MCCTPHPNLSYLLWFLLSPMLRGTQVSKLLMRTPLIVSWFSGNWKTALLKRGTTIFSPWAGIAEPLALWPFPAAIGAFVLKLLSDPAEDHSVRCSTLSGLAIMLHSYDYISPCVPFFDIPVSLGSLLQWIASTDDRFIVSRLNMLSEDNHIFRVLAYYSKYKFLATYY